MSAEPRNATTHGLRPEVSTDDAAALCDACFLAPSRVRELDGYQDANFRVEGPGGASFTLKLSRASEQEPSEQATGLELERVVLDHLERLDWPGIPRLIESRAGRLVERVGWEDEILDVRLLTWVAGDPMSSAEPWAESLLTELGLYLGNLDKALAELGAIGERELDWDLGRLTERRGDLALVASTADRAMLEGNIDTFLAAREACRAAGAPRTLIHHDANPHNVVVSSRDPVSARLVGLIDFGDLLRTETVQELAIAAAYVGFGAEDPWRTTWPLARGYHEARGLDEEELRLLLPAMRARLTMSALMVAKRRHEGTADAYALVSEEGAWETLRRLSPLKEEQASGELHDYLHDATRPTGGRE